MIIIVSRPGSCRSRPGRACRGSVAIIISIIISSRGSGSSGSSSGSSGSSSSRSSSSSSSSSRGSCRSRPRGAGRMVAVYRYV